MPILNNTGKIIENIKQRAEKRLFDSHLYNWSLGWGDFNKSRNYEFAVNLSSPVSGNPETGKYLCEGRFILGNSSMAIYNDCWEPIGIDEKWISHIHSFSWLRDLRSLGGNLGRQTARAYVLNWIENHQKWSEKSWRPDITGNRIKNWIYFYSFFGESADEYFQQKFFTSLEKQAKHLSRALTTEEGNIDIFYALQGLCFAGIVLKDREAWIEQSFDILKLETAKQVLSDGMHISRNPTLLFDIIAIFVEIKSALITAKYPVPVWLQHGLDKMVPALRFFIYQDKNLGYFNGSKYINDDYLNYIISQANIRAKTLKSLPHGGYERISAGRGLLVMDTGNAPLSPYDKTSHAAPSSFEYSYGKDRIIVNCGQYSTNKAWSNMLRGTAAHSSLTIDDRNAYEILNEGNIGRRASNISSNRQEYDEGTVIELSHDGYMPINGIIHRRSIFLNNEGNSLKGEEYLTCITGLSKQAEISLRFHLHPDIDALLTRSGEEIILKISSGKMGYRFKILESDIPHYKLKLEDSIYMTKEDTVVKTKQIVISATMDKDHSSILWSLDKE